MVKHCIFCSQNMREIDFRDIAVLKKFVSSQAKIIDPMHTGVCAKHQRMLARAIKRARFMGLLPYVGR
ncbi:MAG: 30S ribosomal protein S18 [bacterium]|nr:30S ribosomal protein S18 [bacterium]